MEVIATTAHRPTDTDFNATVEKLKDANCDASCSAPSCVIPTSSSRPFANSAGTSISSASSLLRHRRRFVAGRRDRGSFCMTPALYAYPDDPRPEVQDFAKRYQARFGRPPNFHGEVGCTAATSCFGAGSGRPRPDHRQLYHGDGEHPRLQRHLRQRPSFGPDQHHASTSSFLTIVKRPLGSGKGKGTELLISVSRRPRHPGG